MRFWDSSALLPLLLDEPYTPKIVALARTDPEMILWWGTPLECASALARARREGRVEAGKARMAHAALAGLLRRVFEVEPAASVRERALRLVEVHPLRALDALQLAAALVWCGERPADMAFVCLDDRLRNAAGMEGFTVLP